MYRTRLLEKLEEALKAVLPIVTIVLVLSFTVAPVPSSILLAFIFGGLLLIIGMTFFSLGAEIAMEPMGEYMGGSITRTRKLWIILPFCFALGMMITISEPDLQGGDRHDGGGFYQPYPTGKGGKPPHGEQAFCPGDFPGDGFCHG